MSAEILDKFLPPDALPFFKVWLGKHVLHLKITKKRESKLGDYLKLKNGSHQITVNGNLAPELFFFVLTHELAHLIAFDKYKGILPHGNEWKAVYRTMLLESLEVYSEALRPNILQFAKNPKANFMAFSPLVRYFQDEKDGLHYLSDLEIGGHFLYRRKTYRVEGCVKKRYLCTEISSLRRYYFSPEARVENLAYEFPK